MPWGLLFSTYAPRGGGSSLLYISIAYFMQKGGGWVQIACKIAYVLNRRPPSYTTSSRSRDQKEIFCQLHILHSKKLNLTQKGGGGCRPLKSVNLTLFPTFCRLGDLPRSHLNLPLLFKTRPDSELGAHLITLLALHTCFSDISR